MCQEGQNLTASLRLYLVADPEQTTAPFLPSITSALENGVTAVQLRAKHLTDRELLELARDLLPLCRRFGALFLINDRVDIALACGAAGVHLGVDDLPLADARGLLGPRAVIGFSPETDEQAIAAQAAGASYLGVGPVLKTSSKDDAGAPIGLSGLRRRVGLVDIPVIGIGGITPMDYPAVLHTGAAGAAVIGAILRAHDPGDAARSFRHAAQEQVP